MIVDHVSWSVCSHWEPAGVFLSTCDTLLLKHHSERDEASVALPSAMLLATVAGSKVYPGRPHVLMIDSSLAPRRDAYMRPENMEIGAWGVCFWVMNIYLYVGVLPLHKSCPVTCAGPAHVCRVHACAVLRKQVSIYCSTNKEMT